MVKKGVTLRKGVILALVTISIVTSYVYKQETKDVLDL